MTYETTSTEALLTALLGETAVKARYEGTLAPFFEVSGETRDETIAPLLIAKELLSRWMKEEVVGKDVLDSVGAVKQYLVLAFAGQRYESFVTLFLDSQNRLILAEESFKGTLTQTSVYPREIVRRALVHNAGAVFFAHNHPSGCAEPSRADEALTLALKTALELVDVRVLDHLVIAGTSAVSFAERGLI